MSAHSPFVLLDHVGRTPLVELFPDPPLPQGTRLLAKLESSNPGGSLKDRPASRILRRALARGDLDGGRRLLDSSSGNAGIAYALYGALLGVGVTLVVPGNASRERLERIAAHGAELVLTDPLDGYDEALRRARALAAAHPERYWYANQYANDDNWQAHYETTGAEILAQVADRTGASPDAFVAGVGTGGTLTGVGRRLRDARPDTAIYSVRPEAFPGIEGLKPLGAPHDIVPEILDASLIDASIPVSSEQAVERSHELARRGLFVGPSSGAYVHAAIEAARSGRHRTVVTVLNDTGERYASTALWSERREAPRLTAPDPGRRSG
jgi:cysteine synthase B